MSRKGWIITLVAVGLGLAVVVGALANSQSVQERQYCSSLESLESSLTSLTSLQPTSGSSDQLQSDINAVQSDWGSVKNDAKGLSDSNQKNLEDAWNGFESAVGDLDNGGSTADVQNAAKGLEQAVQSSIDSYKCSSSSSSS